MQNSTLKQYAEDALRNEGLSSYVNDAAVQRVIASLVDREERGHEVVAEAGVAMGGNYGRIQQAFVDGGLHEIPRAPEPEPEATFQDAGDERLARLEATVDRLVKLAESHLGATV